MTSTKLGRWLLVGLAIVGLVIAAPAVGAHAGEQTRTNETAADGTPADGDAAEWPTWMGDHATDHQGHDAAEWMESHTGMPVSEMVPGVTDGAHGNGMHSHSHAEGTHGSGMHGQNHADDDHTGGVHGH